MNNQIQVFENREFGKLEVLTIDGQPYFPATECAAILGYATPRHAISRHCRYGTKRAVPHPQSPGKIIEVIFIPECDLYRLIMRSKLPAAELFEKWVVEIVLPSIRRHGAYITDETLRKMRENRAFTDGLIEKLTVERAKKDALLDYVSELTPKARYYDVILQCENTVQVSIIAKDYGMTAAALNKLLHGLGVQYKIGDTWLLYSKYMNEGYTVTRTYYASDTVSKIHTYWTQRGRCFLYDLLKWYGILPVAEKTGVTLIGGEGHLRS